MKLPPIGLGCSPLGPGGRVRDLEPVVERALDLGYALFDTAELYGTEPLVGRALARRPETRDHVVVVSKLWPTHYRPHLARAACERSLRRLGVERIDLYLLHAPRAQRPGREAPRLLDTRAMQAHVRGDDRTFIDDDVPLADTWGALQTLRDEGLVGAIGVSNFSVDDLRLLGRPAERPAVDQIARTPLRPEQPLIAACRERGITVMAHSPFADGVLAHPGVVDLARRFGRSPAQVVLRWNLEQGVVPIPGTASPRHLAENLAAADPGWPAGAGAALTEMAID